MTQHNVVVEHTIVIDPHRVVECLRIKHTFSILGSLGHNKFLTREFHLFNGEMLRFGNLVDKDGACIGRNASPTICSNVVLAHDPLD